MFATINGYLIHYEISGRDDAPPILFLHGLTSNLGIWRRVLPYLGDGFRIISADLLGHGESEKPAKADYSVTNHAAIVLGLLDALGIEHTMLVGHSMGGEISAWIASHHPARIDKLALVSAVLGGTLSTRLNLEFGLLQPGALIPFLGNALTPVLRSPYNPLRKFMFDSQYYARPHTEAEFREIFDEMFRPDNYPAKIGCYRALYRYHADEDADLITAPILITIGDKDVVIPAHEATDFKADHPSAQLIVIPDCGHAVQFDAPDILGIALLNFMSA